MAGALSGHIHIAHSILAQNYCDHNCQMRYALTQWLEKQVCSMIHSRTRNTRECKQHCESMRQKIANTQAVETFYFLLTCGCINELPRIVARQNKVSSLGSAAFQNALGQFKLLTPTKLAVPQVFSAHFVPIGYRNQSVRDFVAQSLPCVRSMKKKAKEITSV